MKKILVTGSEGFIGSHLTEALIKELYGEDLNWVNEDNLIGFDPPILEKSHNRGLSGQRGLHYPEPPRDDPSKVVGAP